MFVKNGLLYYVEPIQIHNSLIFLTPIPLPSNKISLTVFLYFFSLSNEINIKHSLQSKTHDYKISQTSWYNPNYKMSEIFFEWIPDKFNKSISILIFRKDSHFESKVKSPSKIHMES